MMIHHPNPSREILGCNLDYRTGGSILDSDLGKFRLAPKGDKAESPLSHVLMQIFNGAVRKITDADTAFAPRGAGFN
jgi:hypothetical protein